MPFIKLRRLRNASHEPRGVGVVTVERLTFCTLQTIFLLAAIGLVYWIIAPAAITTWTTLLGAFSDARG